ncbi:hypothetical protein SRABI84_05403 [Peribacillus simplex]|uniref:hypothetical protein n=1 Tax=Peribacillus simplex TaxID=1478 RepID=UPI001D67598E|nr:hypothetical protein [Peribacillus simplex]CAH0324272.1 hypothetical protein SRABI84_05403 [Peribacillus simplex]
MANTIEVTKAELEKEIQKANKELEKHGKEVGKGKTKTEAAEPMTKEEVDAIDIAIDKADTPSTEEDKGATLN